MSSKEISKNTVIARAVFTDAAGDATDPDGAVTWSVYDRDRALLATATQALAAKVATGTFEWEYTPLAVGRYFFEALAVVGGRSQCGREEHLAPWVD